MHMCYGPGRPRLEDPRRYGQKFVDLLNDYCKAQGVLSKGGDTHSERHATTPMNATNLKLPDMIKNAGDNGYTCSNALRYVLMPSHHLCFSCVDISSPYAQNVLNLTVCFVKARFRCLIQLGAEQCIVQIL